MLEFTSYMRISYSALETFKQCPLKFKLQYIDKIPSAKSKEAIFGTLIHKTLKALHEPGLIIPTEDEILQFFNNNWDPSIYEDEQQAIAAFSQGIKMLKDYYAKNYPSQFNVVALETPFEAPIQSGNEVHLITGKIDRIDKTPDNLFEVIDYKTTKKMPSQAVVDKDLQLSVYHLGVANRWPSIIKEKRPIKVSLYYLKHGEKLSSLRQAEHLEATKEGIIKTIENISQAQSSAKFEPRPSALCDWCDFQRYCPLFKHKFVEEKLFYNDQDVKALLNEYLSLSDDATQKEKRLAQIKENLGKFMDQQGFERLFSDGGYISRKTIQRFKYDLDLLKEILEAVGKWHDVLKIDEAKLKKILSELPRELRAKIEGAKKLAKEYKNFSIKKEKVKK